MATSIPADAPRPPQQRVQRMDEHGNFVAVPDEPQTEKPTPAPPPRPFVVGEAVTLSGKVMEVQSPQGGQTSVKVQLDHSGGAAWFRGEHITHPGPDDRDAQIEVLLEQVDEHQKQGGKDAARIGELEMQVQELQRQVAEAQVREEQYAANQKAPEPVKAKDADKK